MKHTSVIVTFLNGRIKQFPYSSFEYFASTNELEHKKDNIIITLDDLSRSFTYECDKLSGEIMNKENLKVVLK